MLTRSKAQPKSRHLGSGVACAVALAIALMLGSPATPEGAAAAADHSDTGQGAWPWPLLGEVITPYRNGSDPYAAGQHRGIDIAAPAGTSVRAIVDGRVSFSGRLPDGGQTVTVRSADGAYLVSSLHLASRTVRLGVDVAAGEQLGVLGSSGRRSASRTHLHLSVRNAADRRYVDPMTLLGTRRVAESPTPPQTVPEVALEKPEKAHARAREHAAARGGADADAPAAAVTTPRVAISTAKREGRADSGATESRAAPPPMAAEPRAADRAAISTPRMIESVEPARRQRMPQLDRSLLLIVAVICLVALILRRGHRPATPKIDPTPSSDAAADSDAVAEVIPLHKAS